MDSTQYSSLPDVDTTLDFNNFDADNLDIEEVVNVTFLIDDSISMQDVKDKLNEEIKLFIETLQGWTHHVNKIFVSMGTFSNTIKVVTGFQPIINTSVPTFDPRGGSTKLYDGCLEFLKNMLNQQQQALNAGVLTKNIFFVLTDGEDNSSASNSATAVKNLTSFIKTDEQLLGTFISVMCGIGPNKQPFEEAKNNMGLQKLFVIDTNDSEDKIKKEFKKVFEFLSQSVSSASTGAPLSIGF